MAAQQNKKTRKAELAEIAAPDIVEEELWTLSAWMEKHWKPVAITIVSVSAVWGGIGVYQIFSASSEQSRAEQTAAVFEAASAPVIPPSDDPEAPAPSKDRLSFASDKARADAVLAAAKTEDPKAAAIIGLVVGGAKAVNGDREGQLRAIQAALDAAKGTALELPLHEQKATALMALGKTAEAAAEWSEVAKLASTDFTKALAKVRLGDLYSPAAGSKAPDAAKAKTAYEEALKAARPGDKDPPAGPLAMLAADARGKLSRL